MLIVAEGQLAMSQDVPDGEQRVKLAFGIHEVRVQVGAGSVRVVVQEENPRPGDPARTVPFATRRLADLRVDLD